MAKRNRPKVSRRKAPLDPKSQKSDDPKRSGSAGAELRFYQEKPGEVPLFEFLSGRKPSERAEIRTALRRLAEQGHELRPPLNEHLGARLYYLRIDCEDGTCRVFYWPFGRGIVILGHGFSKKTRKCPSSEMERAMRCRTRFESDPERHTYRGDTEDEA